MHPTLSAYATLLGTASVLTMTSLLSAQAQQQTAQAELPEQVLITGSLIHGTAAVGVPVTTIGAEDYRQVGALTTADVLKDIPSVYVLPSVNVINTGGNYVGAQDTRIHNIGGDPTGPKTMLLVDGSRVPFMSTSLCLVDPSIIPQLAIDRVDVLADGASATYGSDAVAGVINITLKRGYDGAISQLRIGKPTSFAGGLSVMGSQLYGRKWESGDVTVTYEYYHQAKVQGPGSPYLTSDFTIGGYDNRIPIISAAPGIAHVGKATEPASAPAGFDPAFGVSCNNCYSIPKGQNGVGLTWASILANPGVANEYNAYQDSWLFPDSQRNAAVITFDQDIYKSDGLLRSVQFFADGYYNHRRQISRWSGIALGGKTNAFTVTIPTTNPYYPIGAPAGLQVAYNLSKEVLAYSTTGVQEGRWAGGFNLELPANWNGKISYTKTEDHADYAFSNLVNPNLANAAVGNTVAASGSYASYTKPANIPYLNLFCDPTAFTCNDPATLRYVSSHHTLSTRQVYNETNATFDGPLFDLPGGPLRAAIGGDFLTEHYNRTEVNGNNSLLGDAAPNLLPDRGGINIWAVFAQLNIPIVNEANSFPLVKSLEFELSGRIDHYSNFGFTKNPKIAVTWNVGEGLTLRGTAGTSFRAPIFGEISAVGGRGPIPLNVAGGDSGNTEPSCPLTGVPAVPGSAAAILDPNCSAALQFLGGIASGLGVGTALSLGGVVHLDPETARNWAAGFEFAPTDFLRGLDLNFNLYNIKITNVIQAAARLGGLDDPQALADGFFILPSNPNFAQFVKNLANLPNADPRIIPSNIIFIENGSRQNLGWIRYEGIDYAASYDVDLGDLGAWNTGVVGTYVLNRQIEPGLGVAIQDNYKGKDSGGRMNYRARLGWAGGPDSAWSVTGFMNWRAHYGSQEAGDNGRQLLFPPTCFLAGQTPCNASGLPQFAQYTQQYSTLTGYEPAWITFDLSIGYKTGDRPANDYLKNLSLQLVINNFLNKKPEFAYILGAAGAGAPKAFDDKEDPAQRVVNLTVTKVW